MSKICKTKMKCASHAIRKKQEGLLAKSRVHSSILEKYEINRL